jgi:hypothetical protein
MGRYDSRRRKEGEPQCDQIDGVNEYRQDKADDRQDYQDEIHALGGVTTGGEAGAAAVAMALKPVTTA